MKKFVAVFLVVCLAFSCVSVIAEEPEAQVELIVSEQTQDGTVEVSMVAKNAEFQVIQASFYYNPEMFSLPDENVKKLTAGIPVGENEWEDTLLSVVRRTNNTDDGVFTLVAMSNLNYPAPDKYMNERNRVLADDKGIEIFSLKLQKKTSGEIDIGFANKSGKFDAENPNGIVMACAGEEVAVKTVLKLPGKEEIFEEVVPETSEILKTDEELRRERVENSLILQIGNYAAASEGVLCWIDDENKAVMPYIKNNRTMVPLRFVAEKLGLEVNWESETQKIYMTGNGINLVMQIGNSEYLKDGESFKMDAAPELTEAARTFVPLRTIAEAFSKSVHWIENQNSVVIVPKDKPWDEKNKIEQKLLQDALFIMSPLIRDMK